MDLRSYYDLETGFISTPQTRTQPPIQDLEQQDFQLPQQEDEDRDPVINDPRTNKVWGLYTEEEIADEAVKLASLSSIFGKEPVDVSHLLPAFEKAVEMSPELQQDRDTIGEILKSAITLGYKQNRKNFLLWDRDKRGKSGADVEAQRISKEIAELYEKTPFLADGPSLKGFLSEPVKFLGQMGASLQYGWERIGPAAPVYMATPWHARHMGYGEILSEMENMADEIDPEYAKEAATKYSIPFATSEYAGMAALLMPGGIVVKALPAAAKGLKILTHMVRTAGGTSSEAATEAIQTIISNVAKYEALNRTRIDRGEDIITPTAEQLAEGMTEAAIAAAQGAFGISIATSVNPLSSEHFSKLSKATRDKIGKKIADNNIKVEEKVREAKAEVDAETRAEVGAKKQRPVSETNPITPEQSAEAIASPVAEGTNITDSDLDALIISDVEDRVDGINELLGRAADGADIEAVFGFNLRVALDGNEEQAQAIEATLKARASNASMSLSEYLEARKLRIEVSDEETGAVGQTAQVVFSEHETIITAFRQADVVDMAHEIGHVFRRDLNEQQLAQAESIFGVKNGQWTRDNEEAFANGWVQYLQEGQAPTQELQSIFEKFTQWMKRVYLSLRNSPTAGVGISNEARSLFDSLLVADQEGALNLAPGTSLVDELYQSAYHGTPARDIDRFSTDYIGTGEGAQAYGWGLYFAAKKEIANWYRKKLAVNKYRTADGILSSVEIASRVEDTILEDNPDMTYSDAGYIARAMTNWVLGSKKTARGALNDIPAGTPFSRVAYIELERLNPKKTLGQLYKVDVPEDNELLVWDYLLSEQPEEVRRILEEHLPDHVVDRHGFLRVKGSPEIYDKMIEGDRKKELTGRDVYMLFKLAFGGGKNGERNASRFLNAIGIKGHKFADNTSRYGDKKSFNYVIYEGKNVDILDTLYSIPPEDRAAANVGKAKTERRRTKTRAGVQMRRAKGAAVQRVSDILKQSYQAVQAGVQTPEQAILMQLHALADVAQQALDRGDKIGMAKAKADMKVVLAQWKAAQVYKNRVKGISQRIETFVKNYRPKRSRPKDMLKPRLRSQFKKEITDFIHGYMVGDRKVAGIHSRISHINKLRGKRQLTDALLTRQLQNDDLFGNRNGVAFEDAGSVESLTSYWETRYIGIKLRAADPQTAPQAIKELQQFEKDLRAWLMDRKQEGPLSANKLLAAEIVEEAMPIINGKTVEETETILESISAEDYYTQDRLAKWKSGKLGQLIARNTVGKYFIMDPRSILNAITSYASPLAEMPRLKKAFDFFDIAQQLATWIREDQKALDNAYMTIYEISTDFSRNSKMAKDAVKNITVPGLAQKWSIAGIRDLYMKAQDPTLTERTEKNNYTSRLDKQGLTPSVRRRMFRDHLSAKDKMFADWQLQFYNMDERYNRYNDVYKRLNGVDLPRYTNYSPLDVEGFREKVHDEEAAMVISQTHIDNVIRATAEGSGHLIPRTEQSNRIKRSRLRFDNDVANFFAYIEQMNHFAAYAERIRLVRSILNNQNFRDGVTMQYGRKILKYLDDQINNLSTNGKSQTGVIKEVDRARAGFVSAMVAMNMGAALKQQISVVNFWQHMTVADYFLAIWDFAKNPPQAIKEVWEMMAYHPFFLNRRQAIDRDLKAVSRTTDTNRLRANPSLTNFLSMPVRFSDNAAIALGGWALVKKFQREGMTYEEAVNAMVRLADRTQQSASQHEQSLFQQGGSFARVATPFSTGPVQATRQELDAVRAFFAGTMPFKQFVKTMFIYHILVPTMYAMAAEWIQDNEGEEWDAERLKSFFLAHGATYALGPWGATYEFGRLLTNVLGYVLGQKHYQDATMSAQLAKDIGKVVKSTLSGDIDEITIDDWAGAAQAGNIALGAATGGGKTPIQRLERMAQGAVDKDLKRAIFGTKPD